MRAGAEGASDDPVGMGLQSTAAFDVPESPPEVWQERLLPLMVRMIVGLTVFFLIASLAQLAWLQWSMAQRSPLERVVLESLTVPLERVPAEDLLSALELHATVLLETQVLERRYRQAAVLLMASTWVRYLGFITGMILAIVGAVFILGKLQAPESQFDAVTGQSRLTMRSASPGVLLAAFGVTLMAITIITKHEISVADRAVFLVRDPPAVPQAGDTRRAPPLDDPGPTD